MESPFLLAFGEEEFLAALAMAASEAFFNKLLIGSWGVAARVDYSWQADFRRQSPSLDV
jgi:hypothetical protein